MCDLRGASGSTSFAPKGCNRCATTSRRSGPCGSSGSSTPSRRRSAVATAEPPIVTSVWIDAAPEHVFPFFVAPARLTKWLGHAAELEPVPGGRFAVDINQRLVRGSYLEVDSPHRVVFSWGDAGSAELPPG